MLAAVIDSMADGIFVLDPQRRIRYCNKPAGDLLGLDPQALIGSSGDETLAILEPARPAVVRPAIAEALRRVSERPSFQVGLAAMGPEQRETTVQLFPVEGAGGEVLGTGVLLRDVTSQNALARAEERDRIGMDLHDGVLQSLYALTLGLEAKNREIEEGGFPPALEARQRTLPWAVDRINEIIDQIRGYTALGQSETLSEPDLMAGLRALVREVELEGLVRPTLEVGVTAAKNLDPAAVADVLYVAREAVSNVIRHASATWAAIRFGREGDQLVLSVSDDGRGFDPKLALEAEGGGLKNMVERARRHGGDLFVSNRRRGGASVRLELPALPPTHPGAPSLAE